MASSGGSQVSLDSLSVQQLTQVKKQLDEEVEHLSASFTQLVAAQRKFQECLRCVQKQGEAPHAKKDVLVPLTSSLYVRGKLSSPDKVIVDIGTGFYVEKDVKRASEFYESKVKELGGNVQGLEGIVQDKSQSLRVVEEVLKQKMLASQQGSIALD